MQSVAAAPRLEKPGPYLLPTVVDHWRVVERCLYSCSLESGRKLTCQSFRFEMDTESRKTINGVLLADIHGNIAPALCSELLRLPARSPRHALVDEPAPQSQSSLICERYSQLGNKAHPGSVSSISHTGPLVDTIAGRALATRV